MNKNDILTLTVEKMAGSMGLARHEGMTVFIVPPIKDKTTLFWRIKRRIERPYMEKFARSRRTRGE